jgi:adenylate cyclase
VARGAGRRATRQRVVASLAVAAVVTALAAVGLAADTFAGFERAAGDNLFTDSPVDSRIAVVGIDRRAVDEAAESWPWRRTRQADLIRGLHEAGAAVVVYDVVLSPPSRDDSAVAAALGAGTPVVLAAAPELAQGDSGRVLHADVLTGPPKELADAAQLGHVAVTQDPGDGVIRTVPLVIERPDRRYLPGLSLAALMALEQTDVLTLRPDGVQVGDRYVPTRRRTFLDINYSELLRPSTPGLRYVSAADVLAGTVGDRLRGAIVFVGVTDPTLGDVHLTPTNKSAGAAGVYVHANALNTILTRSYLHPAGDTRTLLWVFGLALLVALVARFLRLWVLPLALVLCYAGFVVLAFLRFDAGEVENLVYPGLGMVVAAPAALGLRYAFEDRRRRRVSALFAQYVPEAVADQLIEGERAEAAAAGERLEVAVVFCDLRGFTATAATLPPGSVRELLDVYYEHATRIVLDHGGTLMQFVGDEVFAVFGAPLAMPDHVGSAYACAVALQREVPAINADLTAIGVPSVAYGIGVHVGYVVAAHVGTDRRRQYAVVGNPVNVGARLCSLAGPGEVVLSSAARERLSPRPAGDPLGDVRMKGVSEPVRPWRIDVTE